MPLVTAMGLATLAAGAVRRVVRSMPNYLPPAERRPSTEYQDLLRTIRERGVRVETKQGEDALAVAGHAMRFPMAHGAAVITERAIGGFVGKAIGELCAFI